MNRVPRLVSDGSRTWVSIALLLIATFGFGLGYGLVTRKAPAGGDEARAFLVLELLIGYSVLLISYQLLTWWRFRRVAGETLRTWVAATSPHTRGERLRSVLLGFSGRSWSVTAATIGMGAALVVVALPDVRDDPRILAMALLLAAAAWMLVVVASAVAYLREDAEHGGLRFPTDEAPMWSDLFYLAVQVSTTFSSSDVEVTTRRMRRLLTSQALVAFLFNTIIVALIVSGLLSLND